MKKWIKYAVGFVLAVVLMLMGVGGDETPEVVDTTGAYEQETLHSNTEALSEETIDFAEQTEVVPAQSAAPEQTEEPDVTAALVGTDGSLEFIALSEDGEYTSKEEVALYIHLYGHLPSNFITKSEARKLGWESSKGNLWKVAPGKSIGGDRFGNYEGLLPEKKGRDYYECDIDYDGGYRDEKRIVFSDDGLVYYTEDHYETFELLYGEE